MTFAEFKKLLEVETVGEIKLADDETLKLLLHSAIVADIAEQALPIRLLETDPQKADAIFGVPLNDSYFVRYPVVPLSDDDEIDLDDDLCVAAVYLVATKFVRNTIELNKKAQLEARAKPIIAAHLWRSYRYLNRDDECD